MSEFVTEDFLWTIDGVGWDSVQFGNTAVITDADNANEGIFDTFYSASGNYFDKFHYLGQTSYIVAVTVGNTLQMGSPVVSTNTEAVVAPTGIASSTAFGTAVVTGDGGIVGAGNISGTSQIGTFTASYSAAWNIAPSGIVPTLTVGSHIIGTIQGTYGVVEAGNIASGLTFGSATVTTTGFTNLSGVKVDRETQFGVPRIRTPGWVVQPADSQTWQRV